jgi:hypothetical protein
MRQKTQKGGRSYAETIGRQEVQESLKKWSIAVAVLSSGVYKKGVFTEHNLIQLTN